MMRQSLAAELKMKIDRAERMNEAELTDLRNEIKVPLKLADLFFTKCETIILGSPLISHLLTSRIILAP